MQIELKRLALHNFKGLKKESIHFLKMTNIFGENGSGKTTLMDAFTWLLFGKDSQGRSAFEIKPLDENGEVLHGLENSVEGVLTIDGVELELKKVHKERWEKERGSAERKFKGNTTDYYVDQVQVTKSDYDKKVDSIIQEDIFKLLTSPLAFVSLNWKQQRDILLSLIGGFADSKVLNLKKFALLKEKMGNQDFEVTMKLLKQQRKMLNDELRTVPIRIDEAYNSIEQHDFKQAKAEALILENEIELLEKAIADKNKPDADKVDRDKKRYDAISRMQEIRQEVGEGCRSVSSQYQLQIEKVSAEVRQTDQQIQHDCHTLEIYAKRIKSYEAERDTLRSKFEKLAQTTWSGDKECPFCHQDLPLETIHESQSEFARQKDAKMQNIRQTGHKLNDELEQLNVQSKTLHKTITDNHTKLTDLRNELNALHKELKKCPTVDDTLANHKEYNRLLDLSESLLDSQEITVETVLQDQKLLLSNAKSNLMVKNQILAQEAQNEKINERIEELKQRECQLAAQIAELEKIEYLGEQFIRTKIEKIQSKINALFTHISFKLFKTQVNGAIDETCEALINGVPFSNANLAGQINAGLDIIKALCKHYDTTIPIFIDNRESVVNIIDTDNQIINLYVQANMPLTVE